MPGSNRPSRLLALSSAILLGCATPADDGNSNTVPDAAPADTGVAAKDAATPDAGKVTDAGSDPGFDAGSPTDAGADTSPTDAGADADADAGPSGELFDPTAPAAGDPCPMGVPENAPISRRCGYCGVQRAFCQNRVVTAYGTCIDEVIDAKRCLPNAAQTAKCELCGTRQDTCDPDTCVWSEGTCDNQVVDGCEPGNVAIVHGVCADPLQIRKQTCSAQCVLDAPGACMDEPIDVLVIPTDGTTATATYNLSADTSLRPDVDPCPTAGTAGPTPYHFTRLTNSTAAPVVVETWASAVAGGADVDTISVAYVGRTTRPLAEADLAACTNNVNDTCDSSPCPSDNSPWSGLVRGDAITVPANGTAVIMTAAYYNRGANTPFEFHARVKPAVAPAAMVIPNAVNGTVSATISLTDSMDRLSIGFGDDELACPADIEVGTSTSFKYVVLTNPTAQTAKVEVVTDEVEDTIMAAYPGGLPVVDRLACSTVVSDTCLAGGNTEACLMGANAIVIPPNGQAVLYLAVYSAFNVDPDVGITLKTVSLQ